MPDKTPASLQLPVDPPPPPRSVSYAAALTTSLTSAPVSILSTSNHPTSTATDGFVASTPNQPSLARPVRSTKKPIYLENYHTGSLQSQESSEIPTTASKLKDMKNKLIEKVCSNSK